MITKKTHLFGAAAFGVVASVFLLGAVYNQFSPGGALSGTWNSQNVNVAAGSPFIAGTLPAGNGGTGSAFTQFAGPATTVKTLTVPNANATLLSDANAVTVPQGGTGAITLSGILQGNGASAITGLASVPFASGGTGLTSAADDTTLISSGSAWVASAVPSCANDGSHALVYDTSTNAFACASISGGTALTTGSWTSSLSVGCTVAQNQAWTYSQVGSGTGSIVTIASNTTPACTSNSGAFSTAAASVPAAIRPSRTISFSGVAGSDNSASVPICLTLLANGTLSYLRQSTSTGECGATTFTTSGAKAANLGTATQGNVDFTYRIE